MRPMSILSNVPAAILAAGLTFTTPEGTTLG
jgi:hypothetical protein